MPRPATQNYITEAAKLVTSPQFFIRFFWVDTSGNSYPFSRDLADGTIGAPTNDPMEFLDKISGNTQSVEPQSGQSSIGQLSIEVKDGGGTFLKYMSNPRLPLTIAIDNVSTADIEVTGDISGYPSKGTIHIDDERIRYTGLNTVTEKFTGITRGVDGTAGAAHTLGSFAHNGEEIRPKTRAQVFAGYRQIDEVDFSSIAVFDVKTRSMAVGGKRWSITMTDLQRFMRRRLFLDATQESPTTRTGNPITLLLETLLTSDTAGKNHATYDLGIRDQGADIPLGLVDVAGIEFIRNTYFASDSYSFNIFQPAEAKAWVEKELLVASNLVPIVTSDGKYSIRRVTAPALKGLGSQFLGQDELGASAFVTDGFVSGAATELGAFELGAVENGAGEAVHLTETDIIEISSWDHGDENIVNRMGFAYDAGLDGDPGFVTRQTYIADLSTKRFGEQNPVVIESKGIKTTLNGQDIVDDRAYFLFKRFSEPPPVISLSCFYRNNRIELLDVIHVTHGDIPNPLTGAFGITSKRFEVIDIRPKFGFEGALQLTLLSIDDFVVREFEDNDPKASVTSLTRDLIPPAVPTGLTLSTGTVRDDTTGQTVSFINASWTANTETDLSHYIVKLTEIDGFKFSEQVILQPDVSARFEGVSSNVSYTASIAAVDQSGNASAFSATSGIVAARNADSPTDPTIAPSLATGLDLDAADGKANSRITATATAYAGSDLEKFVFKIKRTADTWTDHIGKADSEAEDADGANVHTFRGLLAGTSYDVKYKWRTLRQGEKMGSEWSPTATIVASTDSSVPGLPTGLSALATFRTIFLNWTNPTDIDFRGVNVYRNTVDNSGTATKIQSCIATEFFADDIPTYDGVTYYYYFSSVDFSGNESAKTSPAVSAVPLQVDAVDYKALSIGTAAIDVLAVTDANILNLNGSKITANTVTTTQLNVSTLSSVTAAMGTVTSGKFQNGGSPTMTIDMDAATISVNKTGGLVVDASDGINIKDDSGIFFNPSGSAGHMIRIQSINAGSLRIEPTGVTGPELSIGDYDHIVMGLEDTSLGFVIRTATLGDLFVANTNGSAGRIAFFGSTPIVQVSNGDKTADGTYGTDEQDMLNNMWDLLVDYGLMAVT